MSVTVTRLENEPILIATMSGIMDTEMAKEAFRQSADLMGDADHTFYRITDVREIDANFVEMLSVIKEASTGEPGSSTDPRIKTTFVGTTTWIAFFRNALQNPKFGGKQMAAFPTMEEALASVRYQIEQDAQSSAS